jgi:thioester reductase-like protein
MSLLRLTHAGRPKTFIFTSSVSTCMGTGQISPSVPGSVPEAPIGDDLSVSLSTGYALSKYIGSSCSQLLSSSFKFPKLTSYPTTVERITQQANKILDMNIKLLRVGQVSGSTLTGHWNTSEMWPIMFATSAHPSINALPLFPGKMVDWVPVDVAASAISDVLLHQRQSQEVRYSVHNIANPHPIKWEELVDMLQASNLLASRKEGAMEEVDMKEWVHRLTTLANSGADSQTVPGLKLLQFFENMLNEEEGHVVSKLFQTEKTRGVSKALRECSGMRQEWIDANVARWREAGFLS